MSYMLAPTTCLIDVSESATTSTAADLGQQADWIAVTIPTITSASLNLTVSNDNSTFTTLGSSLVVVAGTGAFVDLWWVGGFRYIKIVSSATQGADRTFTVQGIKI